MVIDVAAESGHAVTTARDAAAARAAVHEEVCPIVVLDWNLPDHRAVDLCGELCAGPDFEQPYVLVIAAPEHAEDPRPLFEARASDYLLPPLAPARIAARLSIARRSLSEAARRRTAEEAARRQEQFSAAVLETLGSLVIVLDGEGRIVLFNRACESTTGYAATEVVGQTPWDLFVDETEREGVEATFLRLRTGEFPTSFENHWRTKDGGQRRIAWSNTAMTDDTGKVRFVIGTGIDVTEARELAERARRADRLAALGNLAAGLAHEIRNPLNAAGLQLVIVERRLASSAPDILAAVAASRLVRTELQRLQALVEDVLVFARPGRPQLTRADVGATIRGVIDFLGPDATAAGVQLQVTGDEIVHARCDPERIKQILVNLVRNGVEATGPGGLVTVMAQRIEQVVEITVEDTGPGVPDGFDPWEPFATTKEKGTGLGLPTVQRIVSEHGGTVQILRRADRTVVEVRLPA